MLNSHCDRAGQLGSSGICDALVGFPASTIFGLVSAFGSKDDRLAPDSKSKEALMELTVRLELSHIKQAARLVMQVGADVASSFLTARPYR